ncbi:MAG: hypothetical protein ACLGPL_12530 [Acidobacteriota bacterium]
MKIINLDQFKTTRQVSLDGAIYQVRGRTVGAFLNDDLQSRLSESRTEKDRVRVVVDAVLEISDIPEEVLLAQPFHVLNAILLVSQGVDPEARLEGEAEEQGKN